MSDIVIQQGATFRRVYRWAAPPIIYKAISSITKAAPAVVTAASHGVPDGWMVALTNVQGMTEINALNAPGDYHKATVLTSSTIELNTVNSLGFTAATASTGALQYYTPVDLDGYTARMQIRRSVSASTTLASLTSGGGDIVIDNAAKTITVTIAPTASDDFDFDTAVYQLEMVAGDGTVTRLVGGKIKLSREVTR
jgi:hypothetical protein